VTDPADSTSIDVASCQGLGAPPTFAQNSWRGIFGALHGLKSLLWHSELSKGKKSAVTVPSRGSYNKYSYHIVDSRLFILQLGGRYAMSPWILPFESIQLQLANGPSVRPTLEVLERIQNRVRLYITGPESQDTWEEEEEEYSAEEAGKDDAMRAVSSLQSTLPRVWRKFKVRTGRVPVPRHGHSTSSVSRDRVVLFGGHSF